MYAWVRIRQRYYYCEVSSEAVRNAIAYAQSNGEALSDHYAAFVAFVPGGNFAPYWRAENASGQAIRVPGTGALSCALEAAERHVQG